MKRSTVTLTLAMVLLIPPAGCSKDPREAPVRQAVDRILQGLDQADGSALWEVADRETHQTFEDLARSIRESIALVDRWWPEEDRPETRRSVGGDFVGPQTDGRGLFLALLDPRQLNAPRDPDSRRVHRIEWTLDRATVVMRSGDTLEFRQEPDGEWRTSVFLEAWKKHPAHGTLARNLEVVRENARVLAEAATEPGKEAP